MRDALPPAWPISRWHKSISALLRASNPTLAPRVAKPMARRFPMPRPAPVTSTDAAFEAEGTSSTLLHCEVRRDQSRIDANLDRFAVVEQVAAGDRGNNLFRARSGDVDVALKHH